MVQFEPRDQLVRTISENRTAKGLALIVANKFGSHKSQNPLLGVKHDYSKMTHTFGKLKFALFGMEDISKDGLLAVIHEVVTSKNYPPSYRRIVFIYAGHGVEYHICTHTGNVAIATIVDAFQPFNAPHIADIPKLFFFDACRGDLQMRATITARGGGLSTKIGAPFGNLLVAFSTMVPCRAYETAAKGGTWMTLLLRRLLQSKKSILDILTDVNNELDQMYQDNPECQLQQPTFESSLRESIYLLAEAEDEDIGMRYR